MANKHEIQYEIENDLKRFRRNCTNIEDYIYLANQKKKLDKEREVWFNDLKEKLNGKTDDEVGKCVANLEASNKRSDTLIQRFELSLLYK